MWILIISIATGCCNAIDIRHIDFSTKEKCEIAREHLLAHKGYGDRSILSVKCEEK